MKFNSLIFDFGGVLIDWNPEYLYKKVFNDESQMRFFLANVCNADWNRQQDAGRSFSTAIEEASSRFPEYAEEIALYYSRWNEMIGGEILQNTGLIPMLKPTCRLLGLTNWSLETFPFVFEKYAFFQDFEGIVISAAEQCTKPDPAIYQILIQRHQVIPTQSLFIDDHLPNIQTAASLGFQVIHFRPETNLLDELVQRGVL